MEKEQIKSFPWKNALISSPGYHSQSFGLYWQVIIAILLLNPEDNKTN